MGFDRIKFNDNSKENIGSIKTIIGNRLCCKKAYLRGAFLSGGSISDPEKTYHLELSNTKMFIADELKILIESFNLNCKIIKRKCYYVIYMKRGKYS